MSSRPPAYVPSPRKGCPVSPPTSDLGQCFAADRMFDKRLGEIGPDGSIVHSDLGLLLELHEWLTKHKSPLLPPSLLQSLRSHLIRKGLTPSGPPSTAGG